MATTATEQPAKPFTLNVERLVKDDRCEIAKAAWNQAHRFKMLFTLLVFALTVAFVVAAIYAIFSFTDDQQARGFLALGAAVADGALTGFALKQRQDARKDEKAMWQRVDSCCREQPG